MARKGFKIGFDFIFVFHLVIYLAKMCRDIVVENGQGMKRAFAVRFVDFFRCSHGRNRQAPALTGPLKLLIPLCSLSAMFFFSHC